MGLITLYYGLPSTYIGMYVNLGQKKPTDSLLTLGYVSIDISRSLLCFGIGMYLRIATISLRVKKFHHLPIKENHMLYFYRLLVESSIVSDT